MSVYREPAPTVDLIDTFCEKLGEDFNSQRVIRGILAGWLAPAVEIEAVFLAMLAALDLETTQNPAGLEVLGAYVGESRRGRGLETFREAIKVRIRINRSRGKAEDMIEVVALLVDDFRYLEYYPASVIVDADRPQDAALFADAMRRTKPGGVQVQSSIATVPPVNVMRYGSAVYASNGNGAGSTTSSVPYRTMAHVRTQ